MTHFGAVQEFGNKDLGIKFSRVTYSDFIRFSKSFRRGEDSTEERLVLTQDRYTYYGTKQEFYLNLPLPKGVTLWLMRNTVELDDSTLPVSGLSKFWAFEGVENLSSFRFADHPEAWMEDFPATGRHPGLNLYTVKFYSTLYTVHESKQVLSMNQAVGFVYAVYRSVAAVCVLGNAEPKNINIESIGLQRELTPAGIDLLSLRTVLCCLEYTTEPSVIRVARKMYNLLEELVKSTYVLLIVQDKDLLQERFGKLESMPTDSTWSDVDAIFMQYVGESVRRKKPQPLVGKRQTNVLQEGGDLKPVV